MRCTGVSQRINGKNLSNMKKCCRNCKYINQTFGIGAKEEFKLWECTALVNIDTNNARQSVTPNFYCDRWNKSYEEIRKEIEEINKRPKFQTTVCLGKINVKAIIANEELI